MSLSVRRPRRFLIPGPVLIGFDALFENSTGDGSTPVPYPVVKPASMGGVLLPFTCPHCGAVRPEVVHPTKAQDYYDAERGFSWCPACKKRYVIDKAGATLVDAIPAGATHAPAIVIRGDKAEVVGLAEADGLRLLGRGAS